MIATTLPKDGWWIYIIVNSINSKVYVGKTKRMHDRCSQYIYDFRERRIGHLNDHFFNALTKYGIANFSMVPWERCADAEHCFERELFWIDYFKSTDRNRGYNLRRDSSTGMITHPETSAKIRSNLKDQWASGRRDEHGNKLKASWSKDQKRRTAQSVTLSKTLTRYFYRMYLTDFYIDLNYQQLKILGFANIHSNYHRNKIDKTYCKGVLIERIANAA